MSAGTKCTERWVRLRKWLEAERETLEKRWEDASSQRERDLFFGAAQTASDVLRRMETIWDDVSAGRSTR